jgi:hypothetical protein
MDCHIYFRLHGVVDGMIPLEEIRDPVESLLQEA